MTKSFTLIILFVFSVACAFSQVVLERSVISMAGGYLENKDIQLSFTAGDYFVETVSNNDIILTQGFQQPDNKMTKKIRLADNSFITLGIFPNPVIDNLNIHYIGKQDDKITIEIFDVLGNKVKSQLGLIQNGVQSSMIIDMASFTPGLYLVLVTNDNKELNTTFKITKIN